MTKKQVIEWALKSGFKQTARPHLLTRTEGGREYRLKLSSISVRYERKAIIGGKAEWFRVRSGYYKNLSVSAEDGRLVGMH